MLPQVMPVLRDLQQGMNQAWSLVLHEHHEASIHPGCVVGVLLAEGEAGQLLQDVFPFRAATGGRVSMAMLLLVWSHPVLGLAVSVFLVEGLGLGQRRAFWSRVLHGLFGE